MDLKSEVCQLLREIGRGQMTNTAYDTAWIARLGEVDEGLNEPALEWLTEHQLPDGSWGAAEPESYYDRMICTLSAVTALSQYGQRAQERRCFERGRMALQNLINGATKKLQMHVDSATVGFELIAPTLVAEAESLGILRHQGKHILGRLARLRGTKLKLLEGRTISRTITTAFSAEMAGLDGLHLLDADNLQEANGSVGHSPSATAYFALYVRPGNGQALNYLRGAVTEGGAPNAVPFDIFERAWALWNLTLLGDLDSETLDLCQGHLGFLRQVWSQELGVSFSHSYTPKDGDDTAVVCEVLARMGREVDLSPVFHFEEQNHFRCYDLEANPSVSANVHTLGALRTAGLSVQHASVQKILSFLRQNQIWGRYWLDKWHFSPYYPTAHAIVTCAGYADGLVEHAVQWILETQRADGPWGFCLPTAEETAYCLQALVAWRRQGKSIPSEVLKKAATWLVDHTDIPYPTLWISKSLYCPERVVRSAILSALMLVEQEIAS